jgi:Zn-dependent peptidase ImmA (M78 family)/transcriptional regulator with XRE-family HTH domain
MPAVKMSINPAMLAWAMAQAGIDEDALAADLHVTTDLVSLWLSGGDQPSTGDLRQLAKVLHRPSSVFFLPRPPQAAVSSAAFRAPIGSDGERELSRTELDEIRKATRRQKIVHWAQQQLDVDYSVQFPATSENPSVVADNARAWLNWTVETQVKATSKTAVTKLIRQALEERGLLVLQLSMDDDSCRGFSIQHERVPLIAYNTKGQLPAARTFTLLHELGHLVKHEQAVCERPNGTTERWCDEFAAAFLMPGEHLARYVFSKIKSGRVADDDLDTVRLISNRYKASYQCVVLRLITLGLATWKLYALVRNPELEFERPFPSKEVQNTPVIRLREYGTTYARAVLAARDRGYLSETDARKYLNVNGEQLRSIQRRIVSVD